MSTIQPEMPSTGGPQGAGGPGGDAGKFKPIDKNTMQPIQTEMKAMMAHVKVLLKDASGEDATKMKGLMAKLEGLKNETDPAKLQAELKTLQESSPVMKAMMAKVKSQGGEVMKLPEQLQPAMAHMKAAISKMDPAIAKVFDGKLDAIMAKVNDHTMQPTDAHKAMAAMMADIEAQMKKM